MRVFILILVFTLFGCSSDEPYSIEDLKSELPQGYSASYKLGLHQIMVRHYKSSNVQFKTKEVLGESWIVWEKGQEKKVKNAQKGALEEFLKTYSQNHE